MIDENLLEPCTVRYDGKEIHGIRCRKYPLMRHRTPSDKIEKILEEGLKPSKETKSVSLSSNPRHTYGGEVQLLIDTEDLDLRPICYAPIKEISDVVDEVTERLAKTEKEYISPNRVYDEIGVYPTVYLRECEWSVKETIPPDKIKEVEYWIGYNPSRVEYAVSCERTYPHIAVVETEYDWDKFVEKLMRVKRAAEKHGKQFSVKSCFRFIEIPCSMTEDMSDRYGQCIIELDNENLRRIEEGKKPLTYKGDWKFVRNIKWSEGYTDCLCRC